MTFITARVRSTREGNVLTRVCPSICLSTGGGAQVSWQGGGDQVQPVGGGQVSQPMGGGVSGPAGGGGVSQQGGVSILHPLAGGMPLAFTQEDFLV